MRSGSRHLWKNASTRPDERKQKFLSGVKTLSGPIIAQEVMEQTMKRYRERGERAQRIFRGKGKSDSKLERATH